MATRARRRAPAILSGLFKSGENGGGKRLERGEMELPDVSAQGDMIWAGRQLPGAPTTLAGDLGACLARAEDACAPLQVGWAWWAGLASPVGAR